MQKIIDIIYKSIDIEIDSILHFRKHIDHNYSQAVQLILESKGKVIITGVGKSGNIAKKIASTMTSTGTASIFMHPTDAAHGDSGIISKEDVVIAIGKSGESDELLSLIPTIKRIGAKIIAITANQDSRLAKAADIILHTPVLKEACPLKLAPTSSTTIALIVGDALAMALMELKNFKEDDFALFHPSGRLGKRLSLYIEDVMRTGDSNAIVELGTSVYNVMEEITTKGVGATSVVNEQRQLIGFIADYDIRKTLKEGQFKDSLVANDIMNRNPIYFHKGMKAYDVLEGMENRKRPIMVAPIVGDNMVVVGIVSVHDFLQIGLK